jgi:hypothetical protein
MLEFPLHLIPGVGIEGARFGEPRAGHRSILGEYEPFVREPGDHSGDICAPRTGVIEAAAQAA